jgi:nucleotide-binding universal stress UspA family protein
VRKERQAPDIRRILVALDASPHSLAALEAAVDLARRFQAELQGLYVEDVNLLRLAELPFTQEIGLFSAKWRRLDAQRLERQLRAHSARVRRLLRMAAEGAQIQWSFRVVRGRVSSEVMTSAEAADVLIVGKAGWSLIRRRQMGSTARAIAIGLSGFALILQEGTCLASPVALVYDGSRLAQKALQMSMRLLEEDGTLLVLLLADTPGEAQPLQRQIEERLGDRELDLRYQRLNYVSLSRLVSLLERERCGTLVLPARRSILQDDLLASLLDQLEVPVLLVR